MLRLTLAQLNPTVGDVNGNASKILEVWKDYDSKSDLIIFPEMFLCGYPLEDLVLNLGFIKTAQKAIDAICKKTKDYKSACIVPAPYMEDGKVYNTAQLIENGEVKHIIRKHELPNYGVFDEKRTFYSGEMPKPITFKGHKLGVMICEDVWFNNVPKHLSDHGADLLIVLNGSPFKTQKHQQRLDIIKECVHQTSLDTIYLNMVGGQDELVFDGHSFIMDKNKNIVFEAPDFEEDIICLEYQDSTFNITKALPYAPLSVEEEVYRAACLGLRDYVHKNGFKDVLIGLSGGVDSALTAAICVDALGSEHVRCIMMPSEFTTQNSLDDAKSCAEMLGVEYEIISIKDAVKTFEHIIPNLKDLAHENTQSRIRGVILMALSNMSGAMVITTGNKSEMAVGYCTIYGDMNGGYNPLKDMYKTDVYKICKWRNTQGLVIPENIITKAPSAELREDQKDQDSLPPYEELDRILKMLIDNDDRLQDHNDNPATIAKIAKLLKNSEYKRFQSPPGARLSARAFGRDRRYPMTNGFTNIIEQKD